MIEDIRKGCCVDCGKSIGATSTRCRSCAGKRREFSEESRKKMSEAHKGRSPANKGKSMSEDAKKRISIAKKGIKLSEEHIEKLRMIRKGKRHTEETKRKIGNTHKGMRHTEETKKKISKIHKGKRLTEETKRRISEANKGKKHTEESKQKMSKATKGRKVSEEHKRKISEALRGKRLSEDTKAKISSALQRRTDLSKVMKNLHKSPNKLEERVIRVISDFNLPYKFVGDGSLTICGLNPDFVNYDGKKKLIEVFGDNFHGGKGTFVKITWRQTEFGRKSVFSQLGFDTLVLWESELKHMMDKEIADTVVMFTEGKC